MEKVAIIDLGSAMARLVVAQVSDKGPYYNIIDDYSDSIKLCEDIARDGMFRPERIAETMKVLKNFRKLCDYYQVTKTLAYTSSIFMRVKNQKSFLDEAYATTGFRFKILNEEEEHYYLYRGVINSLDIPKGIIISIEANYTSLTYYNRRTILNSAILPFGALTVNMLFNESGKSGEVNATKAETFFAKQLTQVDWLQDIEDDTQIVGVGGSFRNLSKISRLARKYPLEMNHNYQMGEEDIKNVYDLLKVLDIDKRQKLKGLTAGRADTFVSAVSILKSIMDYVNIKSLTISGAGKREGLLLYHASGNTQDKPMSDILMYSVNTSLAFTNSNFEHAEHTAALCMMLFKQLRVLHKLPRTYTKVLRVAGYLHDIGLNVKYYDHHRHSTYSILASQLYGLSHREIVLAAFIAGAHRKGEVDVAGLTKFKDLLLPEDFEAVKRLGILIRIAEGLDRGMQGVITGLVCDVLGDSVILKTEVKADASLEIREATRANPEFRKVYRKNLDIL
ncbi:MAG: Ppx/GppA family phosphatase [Firmicutes bacterium]|nr:Ppx/GppA family phosphatase [Bacillota bacterium]